jgi:type IV pilus assembly protein PilA
MEELLNRADGFTLIELMIVILIIAVLVAIAVPVYLNARTNARLRTCQTNMRTVDGAVSEYEAVFQGPIPYPSSLDVMTNPGTKTLKAVPECPEASNSYIWIAGTQPSISCPNNVSHTI